MPMPHGRFARCRLPGHVREHDAPRERELAERERQHDLERAPDQRGPRRLEEAAALGEAVDPRGLLAPAHPHPRRELGRHAQVLAHRGLLGLVRALDPVEERAVQHEAELALVEGRPQAEPHAPLAEAPLGLGAGPRAHRHEAEPERARGARELVDLARALRQARNPPAGTPRGAAPACSARARPPPAARSRRAPRSRARGSARRGRRSPRSRRAARVRGRVDMAEEIGRAALTREWRGGGPAGPRSRWRRAGRSPPRGTSCPRRTDPAARAARASEAARRSRARSGRRGAPRGRSGCASCAARKGASAAAKRAASQGSSGSWRTQRAASS